jgi:hypothetical protein
MRLKHSFVRYCSLMSFLYYSSFIYVVVLSVRVCLNCKSNEISHRSSKPLRWRPFYEQLGEQLGVYTAFQTLYTLFLLLANQTSTFYPSYLPQSLNINRSISTHSLYALSLRTLSTLHRSLLLTHFPFTTLPLPARRNDFYPRCLPSCPPLGVRPLHVRDHRFGRT